MLQHIADVFGGSISILHAGASGSTSPKRETYDSGGGLIALWIPAEGGKVDPVINSV